MSPDRKTAVGIALAALLGALLHVAAFAGSRPAPRAEKGPSEAERAYRSGVEHYLNGRRSSALASFREALRLDPKDPSARAAVNRVEMEFSPPLVEASSPAREERPRLETDGAGNLLARLAFWLAFEGSVGDALTAQGTQEAMTGKVEQFLVERRLSLARRRGFPKERELRALIRRLPSVVTWGPP